MEKCNDVAVILSVIDISEEFKHLETFIFVLVFDLNKTISAISKKISNQLHWLNRRKFVLCNWKRLGLFIFLFDTQYLIVAYHLTALHQHDHLVTFKTCGLIIDYH